MNHKYQILQLDESNEELLHMKSFCSWDELQRYGGFNINDYKVVYEGEIEGGASEHFVLEDLFSMFNCNHPEDFKGHSLSVSDVVKLNDELWYCDSYCWHKIN